MPRKMSGRKKANQLNWEERCGMAELYEHVKPNRNNQLCQD